MHLLCHICIPKMDFRVSETKIRMGIENTKIGRVIRYTEIPWKHDHSNKRIMIGIEWNKEHLQYDQLKMRLENGDNMKIVNEMGDIWHLYKNENTHFAYSVEKDHPWRK